MERACRCARFLERVGADLRAKYVAFKTADDYPSSIDMATALHPQTLLATQYGGDTLADPFGYPVRLRTATKLGYKNPKWITAIEVTNTYPGGYWESLRLLVVCGDMSGMSDGASWPLICGLLAARRRGPCAKRDAGWDAAAARHEPGASLPRCGSRNPCEWAT